MKLLIVSLLTVVTLCTAHRHEQILVSINPPSSTEEYHYKPGARIAPGAQSRSKRQACGTTASQLTPAQAAEAVFIHNAQRGSEFGSNMLQMVWSPQLASQAQVLANTCTWGHGVLIDCDDNPVGQNLYITSGSAGYPAYNLTGVTTSWYNEKTFWNFNTGTCASRQVCGHYTQVVNARSLQVGCGVANCPSVNVGTGSNWNNCVLVVCNYSPAGNVQGEPMYQIGTPCSNCDSDQTGAGYKCVNNLCAPCTPANDPFCSCGTPVTCVNGGAWSSSTCSCTCAPGYYGLTCQNSCVCADQSTGCPQWSRSGLCTNSLYQQFMAQNCMGTCKNLCNPPPICQLG